MALTSFAYDLHSLKIYSGNPSFQSNPSRQIFCRMIFAVRITGAKNSSGSKRLATLLRMSLYEKASLIGRILNTIMSLS